jgi:hypothetical protein
LLLQQELLHDFIEPLRVGDVHIVAGAVATNASAKSSITPTVFFYR